MKKRKCEHCGFINKSGAELCANCGRSLIKTDEKPLTYGGRSASFRNSKFRRSAIEDLTKI